MGLDPGYLDAGAACWSIAKPVLKFIGLLAIGVYLAIVGYMYVSQRSIMYRPSTDRISPRDAGLAGVEELALQTPDGETLVAWHAEPAAGRPVILFLHGNAGSIGDRTGRFAAYQVQGFGVLYVSYRGYGGSTGSPSQVGLVSDAVTGFDWIAARYQGPQTIAVVGESLGSGVAVQLAAQRKVAALALEAPFTSITDIASSHYWYLPIGLLLRDKFDSLALIDKIGAPLLVSHGEADSIVPFAMGRALFDAAPEPKEFNALPGLGHEAIADERLWRREMEFFERHVR